MCTNNWDFVENINLSDLTHSDLLSYCKHLQSQLADAEEKLNHSITWSVEDIVSRADEVNITISEEDASEILRVMIAEHDSNNGITWETIDGYLYSYSDQI